MAKASQTKIDGAALARFSIASTRSHERRGAAALTTGYRAGAVP